MAKQTQLCCEQDTAPSKKAKTLTPIEKRNLLAKYSKALGHPVRLQILEILKAKKSCICGDLVEVLPVAQATVSQHLKVLKNAGLIQGVISGPAVCYCLNPSGMDELKTLIQKF